MCIISWSQLHIKITKKRKYTEENISYMTIAWNVIVNADVFWIIVILSSYKETLTLYMENV